MIFSANPIIEQSIALELAGAIYALNRVRQRAIALALQPAKNLIGSEF